MIIDAITIRNLELLANRRAVLSRSDGRQTRDKCLLNFFDGTVTKPGHRKLRGELASPPCNLQVILQRQETVSYLIANFTLRTKIRETLSCSHDLDSLSTHYTVKPRAYTMATLKREADNTLRLREVLSLLPTLETILANHDNSLIKQMHETVSNSHQVLKPVIQVRRSYFYENLNK